MARCGTIAEIDILRAMQGNERGMIMNKSMLLFALNVIKNECNRHEHSCASCPFCTKDEDGDVIYCGVRETMPSDWDLLEDKPCDEQLIF